MIVTSWLIVLENSLEINSTYHKGKYVVVERFIMTLKNKIYNWNQYQKMCILIN